MPTALIVDDESEARELLAYNLASGGWRTIEAGDGFAALHLARAELPDVVILDLMLPEMSGEAVFYRLRHHPATRHIPVIMLTAKGAPQHREAGLEMGAEDYVTKPYSPRELAIRLERLLKQKHASLAAANNLEAGPFRLDRSSLTFYLNHTALDLTGTEFRLLMIPPAGRSLLGRPIRTPVGTAGDAGNAYPAQLDLHPPRPLSYERCRRPLCRIREKSHSCNFFIGFSRLLSLVLGKRVTGVFYF